MYRYRVQEKGVGVITAQYPQHLFATKFLSPPSHDFYCRPNARCEDTINVYPNQILFSEGLDKT